METNQSFQISFPLQLMTIPQTLVHLILFMEKQKDTLWKSENKGSGKPYIKSLTFAVICHKVYQIYWLWDPFIPFILPISIYDRQKNGAPKSHSNPPSFDYVTSFCILCLKVKVTQSCPTHCNPKGYTVHGILQARILKLGSLSLLQGIFPTQGSNPGLPHYRQILYQLSSQENLYCD